MSTKISSQTKQQFTKAWKMMLSDVAEREVGLSELIETLQQLEGKQDLDISIDLKIRQIGAEKQVKPRSANQSSQDDNVQRTAITGEEILKLVKDRGPSLKNCEILNLLGWNNLDKNTMRNARVRVHYYVESLIKKQLITKTLADDKLLRLSLA